jgi:hypothetical protein
LKTVKSIIKSILSRIPFKEAGITLLLALISLLVIEEIWDGSISGSLNMNHVIIAVAILGYLVMVYILIKYIRRYLHVGRRRGERRRRIHSHTDHRHHARQA